MRAGLFTSFAAIRVITSELLPDFPCSSYIKFKHEAGLFNLYPVTSGKCETKQKQNSLQYLVTTNTPTFLRGKNPVPATHVTTNQMGDYKMYLDNIS